MNLVSSASSILSSLFGGGSSRAGVTVNLQTAQTHTTVMTCYTVISETLASMPLHLMRRVKKKGVWHKERAYDHPLYNVLNLKPNEEMSKFNWIEAMAMNVVSRGNAYSQILRNNKGDIVGFYPLLTDNITVYRTKSGKLGYGYRVGLGEKSNKESQRGVEVWLDPKEVYKVTYKSLNGVVGLSPISYSQSAIGLSMAMEEFGAKFFENGANIGGLYEIDKILSEDAFARLRATLKEKYEGLKNSNKPMLLEDGLKFKQISVSNNDSQFLESRKFQKAEIASIFRIPPHLINDLEHATFTNIGQQSTEFATYTMTPWVQRFEEPLNIILKEIDPSLYVEFNMNALVRGDIATRYEANGKAIRDSWKTPNEVRVQEGLNPIEGLDDVLVPLNLSQGGAGEKK